MERGRRQRSARGGQVTREDVVAQLGKGIGDMPQAALKENPKKSAAKPSGSEKPASGSRKRLSPTEQHALKTLPARIAALSCE